MIKDFIGFLLLICYIFLNFALMGTIMCNGLGEIKRWHILSIFLVPFAWIMVGIMEGIFYLLNYFYTKINSMLIKLYNYLNKPVNWFKKLSN